VAFLVGHSGSLSAVAETVAQGVPYLSQIEPLFAHSDCEVRSVLHAVPDPFAGIAGLCQPAYQL